MRMWLVRIAGRGHEQGGGSYGGHERGTAGWGKMPFCQPDAIEAEGFGEVCHGEGIVKGCSLSLPHPVIAIHHEPEVHVYPSRTGIRAACQRCLRRAGLPVACVPMYDQKLAPSLQSSPGCGLLRQNRPHA